MMMPVLLAGVLLATLPGVSGSSAIEGPAETAAGRVHQQNARPGNLDLFMARVLAHRDEAWKKLHDYILSETERFELTGPVGIRLHGVRREFSWYVRDGYLIRSPIRFDGVAIPEGDRRRYEDNWLNEEKAREEKRKKEEAKGAGRGTSPGSSSASGSSQNEESLQGFVDQRGEPRFISEAFFLQFKCEAGNYYRAGRERLDGRDVVRIEYYPTNLFGEHKDARKPEGKARSKDDEMERKIEHDLNKVALVTLWIDPAEYQVVRYKFDNVDFGFLPARWLVRLDTITASMTMARVLDGVWLPREMSVQAGLTLASGSYGFQYGREFYDYKKAETAAKVRSVRQPAQ
jgi:hypothetical protein